MSSGPPSLAAVQRVFDARAKDFDDYAFVYDEVRGRLLERLEGVNLDPQLILDLGCANGRAAEPLARRFPGSEVIMLDASPAMARAARANTGGLVVNAALPQLPLNESSMGLVFANLCLPFSDNVRAALLAAARVLKPAGLFTFATLGPDSFAELQRARSAMGHKVRPRFADMHQIGDALVESGLVNPVLDVDYLEITYRDWETLWRELTGSGAAPGQNFSGGLLAGAGSGDALKAHYPQATDHAPYRITLELVFGHAWRGDSPRAAAGPQEVLVPVSQIKRY